MSDVQFQMMGAFRINIQGNDEASSMHRSKKGSLLIRYLILSYPNEAPSVALSEAIPFNLAGGAQSNALKTLVSRTRSALNGIYPNLGGVIASRHGYYSWQAIPEASVDMFELEAIFAAIAKKRITPLSAPQEYERVIALYKGDLYDADIKSPWAGNRKSELHEKYLSAVCDYIACLREQGDISRACEVCKTAMAIDEHDNRLHSFYMELFGGGSRSDSDDDYNISIQNLKSVLDRSAEEVIGALSSHEQSSGAFICAYEEFKDISDIQYRFVERTGATMFVAIIGVTPRERESFEPERINDVSRCLIETLTRSLRKGDAITQLAPFTYAVTLPMVDYATSRMVLERVKDSFYEKNGLYKDALFSYRTQPFTAQSTTV